MFEQTTIGDCFNLIRVKTLTPIKSIKEKEEALKLTDEKMMEKKERDLSVSAVSNFTVLGSVGQVHHHPGLLVQFL